MSAVTLWLLIHLSTGTRPLVVVERFAAPAQCEEARAALIDWYEDDWNSGAAERKYKINPRQFRCIRATVVKP